MDCAVYHLEAAFTATKRPGVPASALSATRRA